MRTKDGRVSKPHPSAPSAPSGPAHDLSEEQQHVLEVVLTGRHVFFTGCAGTGKSFLIHEIVRQLGTLVVVTATTGLAAHGIGGTTIHKFAGIGLGRLPAEELWDKVVRKDPRACLRWQATQTLIIDEVSMLDAGLLAKLDHIARKARGHPGLPFGGLQLVLAGDFYQLPPVGASAALAFEAPVWAQLFAKEQGGTGCMVELTQVYRQADHQFVRLLAEVRTGSLSEATCQQLRELARPLPDLGGLIPTQLHSTNCDVAAYNLEQLHRLPGSPRVFRAQDTALSPAAELRDRIPADETVVLKVGAQVMLTKNLAPGLVNGSRGVVASFAPGTGLPVVDFCQHRGFTVQRQTWEVRSQGNQDNLLLTRSQLPLRLAWAVTIHRSQGLTLDFLTVDLGKVFECGQAYVALSRARTLQGLQVQNFEPHRVRCHPSVTHFYQGLKGGLP